MTNGAVPGETAPDERSLSRCESLPDWLLLPGALLVPVGAELLASFMFVDLAFASFLQ